jgi:hypothetical protein
MTQDEIIDMAREADLDWHQGWILNVDAPNRFETFAKLVAAIEREACAREIEIPFYGEGGKECAAAIRARGQA